MDYSPQKIKSTLNENGFNIKKKYGQNFIADENTIKKIINSVNIKNKSLIIEIGPGIGSLTHYLSKVGTNVLCYEIDRDVEPILKQNIGNNVDIIFDDFLKRDINADIEKYDYEYLYIIANLPYYITTPIMIKIIEENLNIEKIAVMVQKEVGNRFKAKPNTKDYNSLSIYLNYFYEVKKLTDVSRNIFIPVPNVDSVVIEFNKKENRLIADNEEIFFKLVRDSFKYKRKNLRNNLKNYDQKIIENVLKKIGYDLSVRAEQLSIETFINIANELNKKR